MGPMADIVIELIRNDALAYISDELFEYYGWDENNGVLERVI